VIGGLALLVVGGSLLLYRLTLGKPATVRVARAERFEPGGGAARSVLAGNGYIVTEARYISLGVRVPGRIDAYLVEEGERVDSGQPLVRLDARQYETALQEARASLRVARANVDLRRKELVRLRELRRRDFSSEAELDVKENQLRVAAAEVERLEARVAQLELDVEDTVLRAPTTGVVLEKLKEVGEIATPGGFAGSGELIRMADLSELRAELDVNEADLSRVALGQPAEIVPDAYPSRRYKASVAKLDPQINRQKGTLNIEVRILEPDELLRPDMSVRITLLQAASEEEPGVPRVLAPRDAIRSDPEGSFVWVVANGRVERRSVRTGGETAEGRVTIEAGLVGGEALVVGDTPVLREGAPVQIAD
jgi:RND family efflux transporter MFP subunit